MTKIKIIHWDDEEDQRVDMMVILRHAFSKEDYEYQFCCSSIDELIKRLINDHEPFDLLILDLLDKEGDLVANKLLKQLRPEHNVIVLTQSAAYKVQRELEDHLITVKFDKVYKIDAKENPNKEVVFFAIGFETTAPANGMSVYQAAREKITNY